MTRTRETAEYGYRTSLKNGIINGAFDIWQRGTSFSGIAASTVYVADRFAAVGVVASSNTVSQTAQIPNENFKYSLGFEVNTASPGVDANAFVRYTMEGYDIKTFLDHYCVFSFWVRATITGTFCFAIRNGSNNRSYIFEYTIAAADTWQKVELPFFWDSTGTWDKTTGWGLIIHFMLKGAVANQGVADTWLSGNYYTTTNQTDFFATAGNLWYVTGIQIEKGSSATDFEFRPFQDELARCQRYYFKTDANEPIGGGLCPNSTTCKVIQFFPVPMRAAPTGSAIGTFIIFRNAGSVTGSTLSSSYETTNCSELIFTNAGLGATSGYGGVVRGEAGGFMIYDAEL